MYHIKFAHTLTYLRRLYFKLIGHLKNSIALHFISGELLKIKLFNLLSELHSFYS
jgi:hypothetical protein